MIEDFDFGEMIEDTEFDYDDDIELELDDIVSGSLIKERLDSETIKILQKF